MQEKLDCFFRELLYTKSINIAYHLLVEFRNFKDTDWDQVQHIYQLGIDTGIATFEESPPAMLKDWKEKINEELAFVCEIDNVIAGWVTLNKVSNRSVYKGVGEVSIYIHPDYKRKNIGSQLYNYFERKAKEAGYWTIQAQLFTTNLPSKALFDSLGFREVGIRKNIGMLNGEWVDNFLLEKSISDS